MSKSKNKTIGITIGDPNGIGPEITAKAISRKTVRSLANFCIIGDKSVFNLYCKKEYPNVAFLDLDYIKKSEIKAGKQSKKSGKASLLYVDESLKLIKEGLIDSLVTAPVCKEAICLSSSDFHGHTEYIANAFKIKKVGMFFVANNLRTLIVTRHIPIADVVKSITKNNVLEAILLVSESLKKQFNIKNPKIAITGINPHAGEGGRIGKEEQTILIPAIKIANKRNIKVYGPFAADTLFKPNIEQEFDAIIAMYHDQGLGPIKSLYFNKLVNMTIGLPFVRTSPAHGTAFNIAGKNIADESSMCEAIKLAAKL